MQDNEIFRLMIPIISQGLIARGFVNVAVKQSYQPTQQGANSGPTVYMFKIGDHRYGFPKSEDYWDTENQKMVHTEFEKYESTFQINGFVIQNPAVPGYTASDLVNSVSQILQSDLTVQILRASDVGIYRITNVRNPYFTDDKDRFEGSPSFDFTLTHNQIRETINPTISSTVATIFDI